MKGRMLTARIKEAPATPGVYIWRDRRGKPLYVGKATKLRSRLNNYPRSKDTRIRAMVDAAVKLDWLQTPTDIEALILEAQLIKQHRPAYNIVMRDDKQYFLVAITKEDFPHVILTHQVQSHKIKQPVKEYLGPFTEGSPLKTTLKVLRRLFPYCTCKQKHHVKCLNAHIGKCPGYCCLRTSATATQKAEYRNHIRAIRDILTGKRHTLISRMHKEGHDVGPLMRVFQNAQINTRTQELAAHAGALEELQKELGLDDVPRRIYGYDIAQIQETNAGGAMVVFTDAAPDKTQYRLFNIKEGVVGDVPQLSQVFARRFSHQDWPRPDLIVVDGARGQLNAAAKALSDAKLTIPVVAITKNLKHQADHILTSTSPTARPLSELPRAARDLLVHVDSEAHRFSISHYRQRHRKSVRQK